VDAASASRYRAAETALWQRHGAVPVERWVDVPAQGIRVRVLEVGAGRPVLFVPGVLLSGSIWAPLVARLSGFHCIVVDRPGCGLSPSLAKGRIASPAALVQVQEAILDALGVERAHLVGHSFGGGCVLWLAESAPDRVGRIVLEGAPAIAGIRPTPGFRLLAAGVLGRALSRQGAGRAALRAAMRDVGERQLVAAGWPDGPDLDWALALANDTATRQNDVAVLQVLMSPVAGRPFRLFAPAALRQIAHPTLWLWGRHDPLATVEQGRAWAATMPAAGFEEWADGGHVPWLVDPDAHALRIERFLREDADGRSIRLAAAAFP
jgi:pimeloyl-ACP methyl ester carboxylesterase